MPELSDTEISNKKLAALISASAVSGTIGSGFQPLLLAVCLLPLQCAALLWAWQRSPG